MATPATVTTTPTTPRERPSARWARVAGELRNDPGEWHTVADGVGKNAAKGIRRRIVRGELAAFAPAGAFEAVTESRGADGGWAVLARRCAPSDGTP